MLSQCNPHHSPVSRLTGVNLGIDRDKRRANTANQGNTRAKMQSDQIRNPRRVKFSRPRMGVGGVGVQDSPGRLKSL